MNAQKIAEMRAQRRRLGLRSAETVLHEREIAMLDDVKRRLGLSSRSDAVRLILSKVDPETLTTADVAALKEGVR